MAASPARPAEQRKKDTLHRLEHDEDVWVATADADGGVPFLVPLSFLWDGSTLLLATPATSPTGRNLRTTGRTRLGIGPTRDVVMIEGTVETITPASCPRRRATASPRGPASTRADSARPTCTSVSCRPGYRPGARPTSWRGGC